MPTDPSSSMASDAGWSLRLPADDVVLYQGVVSFDEAGAAQHGMVYPGYAGVGGFLVAIFTHGAITESVKSNRKSKLQEEADKVLIPYQAILSEYRYKDLMQRALEKISTGGPKKLVESSEKSGTGWFVESIPVFSMTQDQSAIILDNVVSIYAPNTPSAAAYKNVIRIVSDVKEAATLTTFWTADQGKKLKEESASLLAQSIEIALGEVINAPSKVANVQKTFRYMEGQTEKMERAELISEYCDRTIIKTLRGWLMSVPRRSAANQCSNVN